MSLYIRNESLPLSIYSVLMFLNLSQVYLPKVSYITSIHTRLAT